ncbi:addiction module protein [Aphanothece sacrum]|uniref:Addiction module antitoxin n=1 Tax=Aphanothece sacrum FPU1 TaxID=1920663 RepID=A0A401IEH9_APHSA|nr:addiction module protein [Aphanothece sacrum]GBF79678.1 addiction module antitoxin [Aphanothece sacrum FPU1]GBF87138.1 addiction module antitoxin [Aphanothece sacrum FPU3]
MTQITETLKLELSQLSVQDRAEIAQFLIQSLDENIDENLKQAWDNELNQRLAEIGEGNVRGELAEQVFLELRDRY